MGKPPRPLPTRLPRISAANIGTLHPRYSITPFQGVARACSFSGNGALLALATGENVVICSGTNGTVLGQMAVGWEKAISLAFHPDNTHLAVGGHNGSSLTIWDATNRTQLQSVPMLLPGNPNWFQPAALTFSRSGETLIAQGQDERLVIWNWNGGHPTLRRIVNWAGTFNGPLVSSPDGYWLATGRGDQGGGNGLVATYRYNLDGELQQQPGAIETGYWVRSLCFDGASKTLAYAGGPHDTGLAQLIRLEDGQIVGRYGMTAAELGGQVHGLTLSPWNPLLALSQGNQGPVPGRVHFYDTQTQSSLRSIDLSCSVMSFSPDGKRLLLVGDGPVGGTGDVPQLWTA